MPLQNGLQIVLQYPTSAIAFGSVRCRGFKGFALKNPAFVAIVPQTPAATAEANRLGEALADALRSFVPRSEAQVPCPGQAAGYTCHALTVAECTKFVVAVGDPRVKALTPLRPARQPGGFPGTARTVWVVPSGTQMPSVRVGAQGALNAAFYGSRIEQAVPDLLALLGVASEDFRVFISYRRRDAHALADQLFDAFSRAGFNVFLDRFRIPPGHDFQARIEQELSDKAMVVVIESRDAAASDWMTHEAGFARSRRMGLLGIRLPGAAPLAAVYPAFRFEVRQTDLKCSRAQPCLRSAALERVVSTLKNMHGRALAQRIRHIKASIVVALRRAQATGIRLNARGLVEARSSGGSERYAIHAVPRTPELADFHNASFDGTVDVRPVVFAPIGYSDPMKRTRLKWLETVSQVRAYDEVEVEFAAREIASGL